MEESGQNNLKNLFNSVNNVLIVLPPDPDYDTTVSALSLHLVLQNSDKFSQIGYSGNLPDIEDIKGVDSLRNSIGNKNLHISFDYLESDLEKVDYEVDPDGKFSIVVQPKLGNVAPDAEKIKFFYSGASADMAILFSVSSMEELGGLYAQEKKFLDEVKKTVITNTATPIHFANNLIQNPGISLAETITTLINKTGLKPNTDSATNLVRAIYKYTNNLNHPKVSASTFEALAFLMRHGAALPEVVSQPRPPLPKHAQPPFFIKPPQENQSPSSQPNTTIPTDWQSPKIFRSGS